MQVFSSKVPMGTLIFFLFCSAFLGAQKAAPNPGFDLTKPGPAHSQKFNGEAGTPQSQPPWVGTRVIKDLGKFPYVPARSWPNYREWNWYQTRSQQWTNIQPDTPGFHRKLATKFLTEAPNTTVVVDLSATAWVIGPTSRMFMRLLIDGVPMEPANIVFTRGGRIGARSFSFAATVDRGLHVVEAQWMVDESATGFIKDASIRVRQSGHNNLKAIVPPSGPNIDHNGAFWQNIPGLSGNIGAQANDLITVTVNAESTVVGAAGTDASGHVRVMINGVAARPSDVLFAKGNRFQARSMTFAFTAPADGNYNVVAQWFAGPDSNVVFGDRSLILDAPLPGENFGRYAVVPPSGPNIRSSSILSEPIPGLSLSGVMPKNGELSVHFSGEVWGKSGDNAKIGLELDGNRVEDVEISAATLDGVHSFTFVAKNLNTNDGIACDPCTVELVWSSTGTAYMGDRVMSVIAKDNDVPDPARSPQMGSGGVNVEPMTGTVPLVTVLWNPHRDYETPTLTDIETAIFGPGSDVNGFYQAMSGGKLNISNEGIFEVDAEEESDYYWIFDSSDPDWTGGFQRSWAETINAAATHLNLASYDKNADGVLQPTELMFLQIIPQTDPDGFVRTVAPHKTPDPADSWHYADGVLTPYIAQVYTSDPIKDVSLIRHEIGHLMLRLGDMYGGKHDADGGAVVKLPIDPGPYSVMGQDGNKFQELDAWSRFMLGWVALWPITQSSNVFFPNMSSSLETFILPRYQGGSGKELFLFEMRTGTPDLDGFGGAQPDHGAIFWHIVEGHDRNMIPHCLSAGPLMDLWAGTVDDGLRRGVRTIRPDSDFAGSDQLWDSDSYLLQDDNTICPGGADPRMRLIWADGTPSGYEVEWLENPGGGAAGIWSTVTVP